MISDPTACLTYNSGSWSEDGPVMNFPRVAGADAILLSDGRYFVTGNSAAPG